MLSATTSASLKTAASQALAAGYTAEDTRHATFATVAFLDESVLNSQNPIFAGMAAASRSKRAIWHTHRGEEFFVSLQQLLGPQRFVRSCRSHRDSLSLPSARFWRPYSAGNRGELAQIMNLTGEKMRRIRGRFGALSPALATPKREGRQPDRFLGQALGYHRSAQRRRHCASVFGLYVRLECRGVAVAVPYYAGEG
jgi:hypothetical protein